jgi:hypothetical protein
MPPQLYAQSVATFDLLARVIDHATMFYSQRRPKELAVFHWVVDGKELGRVTDWEDWWSYTVMPMLQSKSIREPMSMFAEGDYSHFARFTTKVGDHLKPRIDNPSDDDATDIKLLMTESFRFSSDPEFGLEMVDVLTNDTRRA